MVGRKNAAVDIRQSNGGTTAGRLANFGRTIRETVMVLSPIVGLACRRDYTTVRLVGSEASRPVDQMDWWTLLVPA